MNTILAISFVILGTSLLLARSEPLKITRATCQPFVEKRALVSGLQALLKLMVKLILHERNNCQEY